MATIPYFAIEQAIATQIADDSNITAPVVVEEAVMMEQQPKIYVYLTNREEPADRQTICGGKRKRVLCHFSIWVFAYAYELAEAIAKRDAILANVESALMKDHAFGRTDINTSWIAGGDFDSAKDENAGFNAGAEVQLVVDVTGTN